jgi:hypothetical protein
MVTVLPADGSLQTLREQHSHRTPDAKAQAVLRDVRQRFLDLAVFIDVALPPSRERSLAQTELDTARMWACNAAVMSGEIREQLTLNRPAGYPART